MIVDGRALIQEGIDADVCIVGAGPAGLAVALELAHSSLRVAVLNPAGAGGTATAAEDLFDGEVSSEGHAEQHLRDSQSARMGGNAHSWNIRTTDEPGPYVRYSLPAELDFAAPPGSTASGWPLDWAALAPFYGRAERICGLEEDRWDVDRWLEDEDRLLLGQDERFEASVFRFGPSASFTRVHLEALEKSGSVTLCPGIIVRTLRFDGDVARAVECVTPAGETLEATARTFVLAAGAVENARILLASLPAAGMSSPAWTGRCFMDHPFVTLGALLLDEPLPLRSLGFFDIKRSAGSLVMGKLGLAPAVRERERLSSAGVMLTPRPGGYGSDAVRALKLVVDSAKQAAVRPALASGAQTLRGLPDLGRFLWGHWRNPRLRHTVSSGGWSRGDRARGRVAVLQVSAQVEQLPAPENRIVLTQALDRLGRAGVRLEWRWGEQDLRGVRRTQEIIGEAAVQQGVGRLVQEPTLPSGLPRMWTPHHSMGTTRMSDDPSLGVVDTDCRLHGARNVYVAGTSVFPTGLGYANPTLTIVALSVRLAEHIRVSED